MKELKSVKIGNKNVNLIGKFQLKVNVSDEKKFRMTNIHGFVPTGKTLSDKLEFMTKSGSVNFLFVPKIITKFNPDVNEIDRHNIAILIQHPNVMIAGMSPEDYELLVRMNLKNSNPKFTLTNIDKADDDVYEDEVELINLRQKLYSLDKPISKEQLIHMASNFGIPYRTEISDEIRYKKYLQKSIDKFIQSKKENRAIFSETLLNMKMAEMKYYISEFIIAGFVTDLGGIYKVGPKPVGASINSIISYFENTPSEFQIFKEQIILRNSNTVLS